MGEKTKEETRVQGVWTITSSLREQYVLLLHKWTSYLEVGKVDAEACTINAVIKLIKQASPW